MSDRNWSEKLSGLPAAAATAPGTGVAERPIASGAAGVMAYARRYEVVRYPDERPIELVRADPDDEDSETVERPAAWWTPDSRNFWAEVLVNPLGGDIRLAAQTLLAWLRGTGTEQAHLEALAPRVIAWGYVIVEANGERVPVEPPATGGWERFLDLPADAYTWLTSTVRNAHLPKAATTPRRPGSGGDSIRTSPGPEPTEEALQPRS